MNARASDDVSRNRVAVCLFLLALVPRLLYLASIPGEAILESVDAQGYDLLARNLRAGHGFSLQDAPPFQPDGLRTPLYPAFVSAVYTLAGERPVVVAALQATLDSFTALLVGALARALLSRRAGTACVPLAGTAAATLYALTPLQWRYTAALLTEVPLAFLVTLALWLLARLAEYATAGLLDVSHGHELSVLRSGAGSIRLNPPPGRNAVTRRIHRAALACGGVTGLAALCKPNLGGLALILALAAWWALRRERRRALLGAGAVLLGAALVVAPWLARNRAVFGRPFLSNAALGYVARVSAPATLGVVEGHQAPPWSLEWEARYHALVTQTAARYGWSLALDATLSPREADRRERQVAQVAWEVIAAHPRAAARAHLVGFLRAWAPQEQAFWYAHLTGRPWETVGVSANALRDAVEILCAGRPLEALEFAFVKPWARLDPLGRLLWYSWSLGHLLAGGLVVAGLWRLRRRPALTLALGATILYATLPPGPIGYERFRVPVVPLITVLEVVGGTGLVSRLGPLLTHPLRGILGGE
jgi:4-amino-4-deoxy-L-arabinose transferase-like glycosyltransferase